MADFFITYWVEIVLSFVSILFGILVSYIFYRLQKRDVVSAHEERVHRAVEELMDVVESYVINRQPLSKDTIHHLISASERAHRVILTDVCSPTSLLQDVSLGLQKSRHLDVAQKSEYAEHIVDTISQISKGEIELPTSIKSNLSILSSIEDAIQQDNKDMVLERINNLEKSLKNLDLPIKASISNRKSIFTETLSVGLLGVLASFIALLDLFSLDTFEGFLFIYILLLLMVLTFILRTSQGKRTIKKVVNLISRKEK